MEKDDIDMKIRILDYAVAVVESYLGYPLSEETYEEDHLGTGIRNLYLYNQPIRNVFSVTINGKELDPLAYETFGDHIRMTNQLEKFPKDAQISVEYIAGYGKRIPPIVTQTILRIASLALQEANSNIGTSGVSLPDGISRSFVSYNNYSRYLEPLIKLRSFEI